MTKIYRLIFRKTVNNTLNRLNLLGVFFFQRRLMNNTIYIKIEDSCKINKSLATIGDVAKIYSANKCLTQKIKPLKVYTFHNKKDNRIVISAVKLIEIINNHYPDITITHIGASNFLLEYEPLKCTCKYIDYIKVLLCSIIIFFGAAFTIMTFNTDVSMPELFTHIYEDITGNVHTGVTILEVSYSIGLGLGIIIFYNHFGGKRLSNDPTPVELEMSEYQTEIQTSLIDSILGKDKHMDVD